MTPQQFYKENYSAAEVLAEQLRRPVYMVRFRDAQGTLQYVITANTPGSREYVAKKYDWLYTIKPPLRFDR